MDLTSESESLNLFLLGTRYNLVLSGKRIVFLTPRRNIRQDLKSVIITIWVLRCRDGRVLVTVISGLEATSLSFRLVRRLSWDFGEVDLTVPLPAVIIVPGLVLFECPCSA